MSLVPVVLVPVVLVPPKERRTATALSWDIMIMVVGIDYFLVTSELEVDGRAMVVDSDHFLVILELAVEDRAMPVVLSNKETVGSDHFL